MIHKHSAVSVLRITTALPHINLSVEKSCLKNIASLIFSMGRILECVVLLGQLDNRLMTGANYLPWSSPDESQAVQALV